MHCLSSFRRVSRVLLVVLTLAIGFAAGSVFVAYGATNDTYNACITPQGDIYRVRKNASWSCLAGHTKISWNQQGPQGIQGPKGIQGIQGPPGELNADHDTSTVTVLSTSNPTDANYSCDIGEKLVTGGYRVTAFTVPYTIIGSYPSSSTNWTVAISFGGVGSVTLDLYVLCIPE